MTVNNIQNNIMKTLLNRKSYRRLVRKAHEFVQVLTGDAGYERPEVNRVALESMLVGWLRGTAEWKEYEQFCAKWFPNENIYLIAQDQAIQAASDATLDCAQDSVAPWFYSLAELNAMIDSETAIEKTRFANKVQKAKTRLGIQI